MNLEIAAVEDASYFRTKDGDIKDAVEEADLVDAAGVDLAVAME